MFGAPTTNAVPEAVVQVIAEDDALGDDLAAEGRGRHRCRSDRPFVDRGAQVNVPGLIGRANEELAVANRQAGVRLW